MHLNFITRGINQETELWKIFMQSQMFPWKRINKKTGKEEITNVQGALRPIQLWEYVFPEESLGDVLAMMNYTGSDYALSGMKAAILRKMLGCKKIPKTEIPTKKRFIANRGVAVHFLGIKKDKRIEMFDPASNKTYIQEGL